MFILIIITLFTFKILYLLTVDIAHWTYMNNKIEWFVYINKDLEMICKFVLILMNEILLCCKC